MPDSVRQGSKSKTLDPASTMNQANILVSQALVKQSNLALKTLDRIIPSWLDQHLVKIKSNCCSQKESQTQTQTTIGPSRYKLRWINLLTLQIRLGLILERALEDQVCQIQVRMSKLSQRVIIGQSVSLGQYVSRGNHGRVRPTTLSQATVFWLVKVRSLDEVQRARCELTYRFVLN